MPTGEELKEFEAKIGHSFRDGTLLVQALTHRSAGRENNERLEFLGDAVLSYIIADRLFNGSDEAESMLTRQRSLLTDRLALEIVGERIGIRHLIITGKSIKGKASKKMVSDSVEALFGAVYLDAGLDRTISVVDNVLLNREVMEQVLGRIDWITRLKELCDAQRLPRPNYLTFEEVVDEVPSFVAWVSVENWSGQGVGETKKEAMAQAAQDLMARSGHG